MPHILFIKGLSDDNWVQIALQDGKPRYNVTGNCNLFHYVDWPGFTKEELVVEGIAGRDQYSVAQGPDLVFNEISDTDSHPNALKISAHCCEQLVAHFDCPVINNPALIAQTGRDHIAERLQNIPNLIVPKTIRCALTCPQDAFDQAEKAELKFPFLVRIAGKHKGESTIRINSEDDKARLHRFAFDGRDYYLTQFVDTQLKDGLYRKYRVVIIEGKPYLRHALVHDDWFIHGHLFDEQDPTPERFKQCSALITSFDEVAKPLITPITQAMYDRIGLDYFGLDFTITDDQQVILFEANANMNVFYNKYAETPEKSHCAQSIAKISDALLAALKHKITRKNRTQIA